MVDQIQKQLESFTKALNEFKASLDKYTEAVSETEQAQEHERQHPLPVNLRAKLRLPVAVRKYCEAEQRERQSAWRKVKAGLEILGVATALVLVALTYFSLREVGSQARSAQEQITILQTQLEAADRPWIKVVDAKATEDLVFMSDWHSKIAGTTLTITAKNVGHSVALDVFVQAEMTFIEDNDALVKEQEAVCKSTNQMQVAPHLNLFPDDDSGDSFFILGTREVPPLDVKKEEFLRGSDVPPDATGNTWKASPKFVGCIVYTIASSQRRHVTGFIYGLEQEIPKKDSPFGVSYYPRFFRVGIRVPKEKLIASRYALGITAN